MGDAPRGGPRCCDERRHEPLGQVGGIVRRSWRLPSLFELRCARKEGGAIAKRRRDWAAGSRVRSFLIRPSGSSAEDATLKKPRCPSEFYRAAVTDLSPGLQPWVTFAQRIRPARAAETKSVVALALRMCTDGLLSRWSA